MLKIVILFNAWKKNLTDDEWTQSDDSGLKITQILVDDDGGFYIFKFSI